MNKIKVLLLILLLAILPLAGCKKENDPSSYDIYIMAQESGYDGTYSEWKKLVGEIEDTDIIKIEISSNNELIVTLKNNEIINLGKITEDKKTYVVNFISLNEKVHKVTVDEGSLVDAPEIKNENDDVLVGWYYGDDKWRFNLDTVQSDMTLVAKWEKFIDKITPVFQGMSVESQTSPTRNKRNLKSGDSDIEDAVNDYLDIITTDKVEYYAKKSEKFNVVVHLYNPSYYEILSFTLNGRKYQSFEFKEGSNSSQLIIEVDAGVNSGIAEYTIDAIKYVDEAEIKDVRMDGEKTIRVGVQYDVIPNASLINEMITSTSYESIIEIKDDMKLIDNEQAYFFLYDGKNIIYNTPLKVGINEIKYDNLQMGTNYEYIIIGVFDDYSGKGKRAVPLMQKGISSPDGFHIDKIQTSKTSISFDVCKSVNGTTIKEVNLISGDNVVATSLESGNVEFKDLLTNTEYVIEVIYTYPYDGALRENKLTKTVKTLSNSIPEVEITSITSTKYDITYSVTATDEDGVILDRNHTLYLGDEKIASSKNINDVFKNLLSNNLYHLEVKYTYDLNNGEGEKEIVVTKDIRTKALETPKVDIFTNASKNQIILKEIITDNDNILKLTTPIVKDETQLEITEESKNYYVITNVLSNKEYVIIIKYSYDLNDGNGICEVTRECKVLTFKEDPKIIFTSYAINDTSVEYNLLVTDKNNVGHVNFIALYEGSTFIDRLDDTMTKLQNLKSNTNYKIKINYVYDFDDGYGSRELNEEFEFITLKTEPIYQLSFSNITKFGFSINHYISDNDASLTFNKVNILYNNQVVKTTDNLKDVVFDDLLSDTNYLVNVIFTKDLNNGEETVVYSGNVTTECLESPSVEFNYSSSKNSLQFTYDVIDNDNVSTLKDVLVYYNNQIIKPDDNGLYTNLLSNTVYTIKVTLLNDYNDGRVSQEETYTKKITTKSLEDIIFGMNYEIGKKAISFNYDIIDQDNISAVKEVKLYRGNQLVQKIDGEVNKEFTNLLSNTLYKIVYVIEKDFNDGNELVISEYEEYITTKSLLTPSVDIAFTSTQDSIFYKLTKVDNDNILDLVSIDVYDGKVLVKKITDFSSNEITELDSNTRYTISVTYKYNLNEDEDDIYKVCTKDYSTLSYNVKIVSSEVINDKTPKTNEDVSIKLILENKSKVKVDYLVVNGTKYLISGGDEYYSVIIIVRSPKMSGIMELSIEKMGYTINGLVVEQNVEGEQKIDVEILSRLDVVSVSLVNGGNLDKNAYSLGYVFTIDNPHGYTIEKINDYECIRIDDYHWYVRSIGYDYSDYKFYLRSLTYRNEDNELAVRNYTSTIDGTFMQYQVDLDTYLLVVKQVSTPEEFMNMNESYIYELANDIDMSGYAWEPYAFWGYFDGKGHTISNLTYIYESESPSTGGDGRYGIENELLNTYYTATFKNVYFKDIYFDVDYPQQDSSQIITGEGIIENVLISGYVNYKSNYGDDLDSSYYFDPSNITNIVDHLYVNNVLFESDKNITIDTFNSTDFKENTLGWKFTDKVLGNYNGYIYNIIDNSYILISGYDGEDTEIIIPSTIEGLPVIGIEDMAFAGNNNIKSIVFPDSLVTIGTSVIRNCDNIEDITILDVSKFTYREFYGNFLFGNNYSPKKINNLIVDSSENRYISFENTDKLNNVELKGKLTLSDYAFSNCNSLRSITLPDSIVSIGYCAFSNCNSLRSITLPDSIVSIGYCAFVNCYNLTNVYYNGTIEDWCNITFDSDTPYSNPMYYASHFFMLDEVDEYKEVTEITIPGSVKEIGEYQFYGFDNVHIINMSEGVEKIESSAFFDCNSLRSITLPDSIVSIGYYAFANCYNLTNVFYGGSEEDFNKIEIDNRDNSNWYLINASIMYNYKK